MPETDDDERDRAHQRRRRERVPASRTHRARAPRARRRRRSRRACEPQRERDRADRTPRRPPCHPRAPAALTPAPPEHQRADLGAGGAAGASITAPRRGHDHPVGQLQHLVEIARVQQDGRAGRGRVAEPVVDRRGCADVQPARRVLGHDHPRPRAPAPAPRRSSAGCRRSATPPARRARRATTSIARQAAPPFGARTAGQSIRAAANPGIAAGRTRATTFSVSESSGIKPFGGAVLRNERRPARPPRASRAAGAGGRRWRAAALAARCPRPRPRRRSRRRAPERRSAHREPVPALPRNLERRGSAIAGAAPAYGERRCGVRRRPSSPIIAAASVRGVDRRRRPRQDAPRPARSTVTRSARRERLVQLVGDEHGRAAALGEAPHHAGAARPPRPAPARRSARRAAGSSRRPPAP